MTPEALHHVLEALCPHATVPCSSADLTRLAKEHEVMGAALRELAGEPLTAGRIGAALARIAGIEAGGLVLRRQKRDHAAAWHVIDAAADAGGAGNPASAGATEAPPARPARDPAGRAHSGLRIVRIAFMDLPGGGLRDVCDEDRGFGLGGPHGIALGWTDAGGVGIHARGRRYFVPMHNVAWVELDGDDGEDGEDEGD